MTLRFVIAIVCFFLSAISLSLGIAQRTVWLGPDTYTESVQIQDTPLAMVTGSALTGYPGKQSMRLAGADSKLVAYGRAADVEAWIGDTTYTHISRNEAGELTQSLIQGSEAVAPNPAGSDLWLDEFIQDTEDDLRASFTLSSDTALLVAIDGTKPIAAELTLQWPRDNSTPYAGPLILAGAVLAALGFIAYISGLIQWRRQRGPRRKSSRAPKPPKPISASKAYKPSRAGIAAPQKGRRAAGRSFGGALVGIALVPALLAGCTPATQPTPSPEPTVDPEPVSNVAVTEAQLNRILARVKTVIDEADAEADQDLLATRAKGASYDARVANYTIRSRRSSIDPLPQIPAGPPQFVLPEATLNWPRTAMAVVVEEAEEGNRQVLLVLEQASPREPYRLVYDLDLVQSLPAVAAPTVGAPRLAADLDLLLLTPKQTVNAYAKLLLDGEKAEHYDNFEILEDSLPDQIGAKFKADRKRKLQANARVSFGTELDKYEPLAFSTADSGALVAGYFIDTETVRPRGQYQEVAVSGESRHLLGKASTMRGITVGYGIQLLFYVPVDGDAGQIRLLGYQQQIVSAKEVR